MKIAIADRKGSFSDYWIKYCEEHSIPYKVVNPYDTDIVEQVSDCDAFMWHHHHASFSDTLFAKQLLFSLEQAGKIVFPNFRTGWHFDDKLGQKYLFEALGVRAAKSWVFYDKKSAYKWIETTDFPKVFKLRGGAGSANVRLARSKRQAKAFVRKALCRGFASTNPLFSAKTQWQNFVKGQGRFYDVAKYIGLYLFPRLNGGRRMPRQKGYAYFQEFIPNDGFDLRVIVIGNKAFAIRRETRQDDFRASGSGEISYKRELFNEQLIQLAFEINQQIKSQCLALDFVKDMKTGQLYAVEISYGYSVDGYLRCSGYWTSDLSWHEEHFDSCGWMVEEVMTEIDSQKQF
ncbi:ATP-grasp domain-containing protein [Porphyromonas sp.]|uniref:ATP-grasp domain-containing protein n=1 Tax=Porphyromonas sp. TaxID=1924944 RepID=UPI003A945FE8